MQRLLAPVVSLLALLACGREGTTQGAAEQAAQEMVFGVSFNVRVGSRPANGIVSSSDGRINCGYPTAATACSATYGWSERATLTATPKAGYAFQSWAGDCGGSAGCVLASGADRTVYAFFAVFTQVGHSGNFSDPAQHGPAFLDFLGKVAGAPGCTASSCHGPNLTGVGIAPGCDGCHQTAGYVSWRTDCSFCHGARTAQSKAGYDVAVHPTWAAPPDDVRQRLGSAMNPARTGAHQAHLTGVAADGTALAAPFPCGTCHAVPSTYDHVGGQNARATVALTGSGQLPAALGTYDASTGTCAAYCHGPGGSPVWGTTTLACDACHGLPPPSPHPAIPSRLTVCVYCHAKTMNADGTLNVAGGKHVNGVADLSGGGGGVGCGACHGFPPDTGAHLAHFGITGAEASGTYGDTSVLQDRYPAATPTTAPAAYAFGCGNCHPVDPAKHMDGTAEVVLHEAGAPAGSLKARSATDAAYDPATRTCSGTYCHSSGQPSPVPVASPDWSATAHLGCAGCHGNPPRYASGDPGSATANSHLGLADDGFEFGHFLGEPGPWHQSKHGGWKAGQDAAPITCQTCHYDTADPANVGPSGFYYLDTSGDYQLAGGYAGRTALRVYQQLQCTACHAGGGPAAGSGKVLPLRHVNGARDVVFDPRTALPQPWPWLPGGLDAPSAPYWLTDGNPGWLDWPAAIVQVNGTTVSFGLAGATYDPATKRCGNVACHMAEAPVWGRPYGFKSDFGMCLRCHPRI
ncbi:CxxxxCH/CxxCH domain c-type cytochrome [Anaeromyxobacter paludicola]|uniref:CxxxxCH/CxxCH domain c-type cytochrome n=1 Tax=Anaeromyxobacter paludicola TaxID=2918171 RepID=UPI0020C039EF|nr:CxxxxCH/CxxCH domain-containing protein [Anaeromyxobacter paludicola]